MTDRHGRSGNAGSGARDSKHSTARQGSASRASERPNGPARNGVSPAPNGPAGAQLRTFLDAFTIGRSRRCDLVIPTSDDTRTISKTHARIFPLPNDRVSPASSQGDGGAPQKWMLQDLNTLNGTSINGMDLMPGGSMELHDGDELVLSSNLRTGMRLFVQIPDIDQSRLVARLYGPNSGYRPPQHAPAGFAGTPLLWRGGGSDGINEVDAASRLGVTPPRLNGAATVSPLASSFQTPPRPPPRTAAASSLIKRQRSTDERSTSHQSDNGQDAASATHDSKRSRRGGADDKERLMLCPVCIDYFSNSATLACSHTFCGHCLSHWFRTSAALSCPECRAGVRHVPVRNRALDDLVHALAGDTDAYRAAVRKRTTEERVGAASFSHGGGFDLLTHPLIFSLWHPDEREAFRAFLGKQFGDARVAACRQIGLTGNAIDAASGAELHVAAQNLLIDCADLRASHEASERLKIYLHYG